MKKILSSLILASLLATPLLAIDLDVLSVGERPVGEPPQKKAPNIPIMGAIDNITDWLFYILTAIAIIFIIIAAFLFVTAAGSTEQIAKARNMVLYAIIGLVVALLARGIVALIEKVLK